MLNQRKFKLGCRKDKRDDRDYLMRAYLPMVKIPKKVDYTSKMTPVRNQGNEGTCVGFATSVGMKEYQEFIDYGIDPRKIPVETGLVPVSSKRDTVERGLAPSKHSEKGQAPSLRNQKYIPLLSPRFLYNECKKIDKIDGEGTQIRIAMKVLKNIGVCREQLWRYEPRDPDGPDAPVRKMVADAKKNRVLSYARILDLDELRLSLATKGPCVIGIICFKGIMKTRTGRVPMPTRGDRQLGGHAICPVGYDDSARLIKFKNSWSEEWGDKGYGYLPYKYVVKYMIDAWSSVDIIDSAPLTVAKVLNSVKK